MGLCQIHPQFSIPWYNSNNLAPLFGKIQVYKMIEINYLKVVSVIKKLFESTLFVAYLYMTVKALCDLFSFKTTINISREHRNITMLPAFSVCENWESMVDGYNKEELANGSMGKGLEQPFPVLFTLEIGLEDANSVSMNLKNESAIRDYLLFGQLEEMWTLHCKPFPQGFSHCMPCITFNGARVKQASLPPTFATVNSISN